MISTAAAADRPTASCTSADRNLIVRAAESTRGVSTGADTSNISASTQFRYSSTPMIAIVSSPDRIPRAPSSLVTVACNTPMSFVSHESRDPVVSSSSMGRPRDPRDPPALPALRSSTIIP